MRRIIKGGSGAKKLGLTTPDLLLLSLLAERPMHGYQANAELERRQIRDWADVSRPQVYYSLNKLAQLGYTRVAENEEPAEGPERRIFETTAKGREMLADALERQDWATQRERPAFLIWLALSWLARPGIFEKQIEGRKKYLQHEIARETKSLRAVIAEVGHSQHEAVWMIKLIIEQFETELGWLDRVAKELKQRGRAKRPSYAGVGEAGEKV